MQMHMSVENFTVEQCKAMKLFSPEKVLTGGGSCCINNTGAFKDNTRAQGKEANIPAGKRRMDYIEETKNACCNGFKEKTNGTNPVALIGCPFSSTDST